MKSIFTCPVCRSPLEDSGKSLICPNRHSFDKAAQGYVHLLPANKMNSKLPGDSKEMVAARTAFLSLGFYQPFCDGICDILCSEFKGKSSPVIVDAGCGEGYYTSAIYHTLSAVCDNPVICGFDISKFAVKAAAKCKPLSLAVASCFDIPLADSSADALTAVFSPIVPEEFARVVKPGGIMVLAVASPRHLMGLKELLYEKPYENERKDTYYEGFRFEKRVAISSEAQLNDNASIRNLFAMTPYYWKTPIEGSRRLAEAQSLYTELGFDLLVYRRI